MENQREKNMENEMETVVICGFVGFFFGHLKLVRGLVSGIS